MALTTAPVNAWLLAWVALAPLWILVVSYQRPNQEVKQQKFFLLPASFFLLPSLWGIGYHGLALSWIMGIHPMTWLGVPWWPSLAIALFCWAFITLWGAALVAVWAWLFAIAISKISGTGILPVISQKISGTGILPVIPQKISGTGILPVISQKISGTGILPVSSQKIVAQASCLNSRFNWHSFVVCLRKYLEYRFAVVDIPIIYPKPAQFSNIAPRSTLRAQRSNSRYCSSKWLNRRSFY